MYYRSEPDSVVAKHVMQQHQLTVITSTDDEGFQRITVQRSHFFLDPFCAFSKSSFNVSKLLKVVFVGESSVDSGVDSGGPRQEFFQLLNEGSLYRIRHICRVARQCCTNPRCRGCGCPNK